MGAIFQQFADIVGEISAIVGLGFIIYSVLNTALGWRKKTKKEAY